MNEFVWMFNVFQFQTMNSSITNLFLFLFFFFIHFHFLCVLNCVVHQMISSFLFFKWMKIHRNWKLRQTNTQKHKNTTKWEWRRTFWEKNSNYFVSLFKFKTKWLSNIWIDEGWVSNFWVEKRNQLKSHSPSQMKSKLLPFKWSLLCVLQWRERRDKNDKLILIDFSQIQISFPSISLHQQLQNV